MITLTFITLFMLAVLVAGWKHKRHLLLHLPAATGVVFMAWVFALMQAVQQRGHLAQGVVVLAYFWLFGSTFVGVRTQRRPDTIYLPRFWQLMRWPTVLTVYAMLACIFAAHQWGFSMQWWTP